MTDNNLKQFKFKSTMLRVQHCLEIVENIVPDFLYVLLRAFNVICDSGYIRLIPPPTP